MFEQVFRAASQGAIQLQARASTRPLGTLNGTEEAFKDQ